MREVTIAAESVNDLCSLQGKPELHGIEIYDHDRTKVGGGKISSDKSERIVQPCVRDVLRCARLSSFMAHSYTLEIVYHSSTGHKYSEDMEHSYAENSWNRRGILKGSNNSRRIEISTGIS